MSETREPRPKDVHGNEIVMGAWYWSRNRKRQVIGTGKFACAIGGGDVTWFINGIGYSPEGFEFVPVDSPSFDLINVPESVEAEAHDDLRERVSKLEAALSTACADHAELRELVRKLESETRDRCDYLEQQVNKIKNAMGPAMRADARSSEQRLAAEAEARIAAARKEKPRLDDAFPIPPTAERESEPTPGADCVIEAATSCVDLVESVCRVKLSFKSFRDSINRHVGPELAELRAEIERLKADNIKTCQLVADMHAAATGKPGDGPRRGVVEDIADLRQQLATANAENKRQRQIINDNFASTAERVAELEQQLATATAERDEARKRIEPAEHRRIDAEKFLNDEIIKRMELEKQLATHREAAEAMEWLALNPDRTLIYGFNCSDRKGWCTEGTCFGVYPTPTAAILAAKAATTNTGERT